MATTALDFLFEVGEPFLAIGPDEPERVKRIPGAFYRRDGVQTCVRTLRGSRMRTTTALMDEVSAALQFPLSFGANWHALEELLSYLDEWLPADAYVLVVEEANQVLADDPDELSALIKTVRLAGESWAQPIADHDRFDRSAIPFHVLVYGLHGGSSSRFLDAAALSDTAVRIDS